VHSDERDGESDCGTQDRVLGEPQSGGSCDPTATHREHGGPRGPAANRTGNDPLALVYVMFMANVRSTSSPVTHRSRRRLRPLPGRSQMYTSTGTARTVISVASR
jgi:hypothetical protein